MRSVHRAGLVATLGLLFLAAVPGVAVASSVTEQLIRNLNQQLLYLAVPIAVLVEIILIYTVWRFRANGDNDDEPQPTRENRQLEITWTIATAIVLLFVGTASFHTLAHPTVSTILDDPQSDQGPAEAPEDAIEVNVVAE
jgi:cytochrome c oxidase subunit 2